MRMHRGLIESTRVSTDLATNETEDLRELAHFPYLREVLKIKNNRGLSLDERIYFMDAKLRQLYDHK